MVTLNKGFGFGHFFLIDCLNAKKIDPWALYKMDQLQDLKNQYMFFYNVNPVADIEKSAVSKGVNGIYYNGSSFKGLPKALNAILEGELWFSRKILSKNVRKRNNESNISESVADYLTPREKEILIHLSSGAHNQKIADDLCVSLYTVKSHIYRIYKKINVTNRLQASFWAAKYL